jgi:hypothetical protein
MSVIDPKEVATARDKLHGVRAAAADWKAAKAKVYGRMLMAAPEPDCAQEEAKDPNVYHGKGLPIGHPYSSPPSDTVPIDWAAREEKLQDRGLRATAVQLATKVPGVQPDKIVEIAQTIYNFVKGA